MALTRSQKIALARQKFQQEQHRRKMLAVISVLAGVTTAVSALLPRLFPRPQHTSILTGAAWMNELLRGHPETFHDMMGMSKEVFRLLLHELGVHAGLCDSKYIPAVVILGMFLHKAITGNNTRHIKNRFQLSGDTVNRHFHNVLDLLISPNFYHRYVHLPASKTPSEISTNPKLFPYFRRCLGSLDGSHIDARVPAEDASASRNRKGRLTQNVLAACTFSMLFCYILPGWEGSAADGKVFEYAREHDFAIPDGWFYLGDAGYPSCAAVLVPYRGVRYHLKEWAQGNQKPQTKEELFNLRHAQARNVIERIFGIFKRKFYLLIHTPEFDLKTQAKIVAALAVIFNFIRIHDPEDINVEQFDARAERAHRAPRDDVYEVPVVEELGGFVSTVEKDEADSRRDGIAERMWADYKEYLQNGGDEEEVNYDELYM